MALDEWRKPRLWGDLDYRELSRLSSIECQVVDSRRDSFTLAGEEIQVEGLGAWGMADKGSAGVPVRAGS